MAGVPPGHRARHYLTVRYMHRTSFLMISLLLCGPAMAVDADSPGNGGVYVEFLWEKTPDGALARQETRSFALDGRFDHQVCVAILDKHISVSSLELRGVGEDGQVITRTVDREWDGRKKCFSADLPATARPGKWTYKVLLNDQEDVVGERAIDVYPTVEALVASTEQGMPYVLGRPNYDSSITPEQYDGELVWVMYVNKDGTVSRVTIERAEGIGVVMQPKAIAAGLLSLFPSDPGRKADATFRRHLSFRPDD